MAAKDSSKKVRGNKNRRSIPTEYQNQFLKLNFEDFVQKTNVSDLIRIDYFTKYPEAKKIPPEKLAECEKYYFDNIYKVSKWESCSLKNLKFKPEPSNPGNDLAETQNEAIRPHKNQNHILNGSQKNSNADGSDNERAGSSLGGKYNPTEQQLAIAKLSYENFKELTNIKDVLMKIYHKTLPENDIPPEPSEENIIRFYKYLPKFEKWSKVGLADLTLTEASASKSSEPKENEPPRIKSKVPRCKTKPIGSSGGTSSNAPVQQDNHQTVEEMNKKVIPSKKAVSVSVTQMNFEKYFEQQQPRMSSNKETEKRDKSPMQKANTPELVPLRSSSATSTMPVENQCKTYNKSQRNKNLDGSEDHAASLSIGHEAEHYKPTKLQEAIAKLSYENFKNYTNIKDILINMLPDNDISSEPAEDVFQKYYKYLPTYDKWSKVGLGDLIIIEPSTSSLCRNSLPQQNISKEAISNSYSTTDGTSNTPAQNNDHVEETHVAAEPSSRRRVSTSSGTGAKSIKNTKQQQKVKKSAEPVALLESFAREELSARHEPAQNNTVTLDGDVIMEERTKTSKTEMLCSRNVKLVNQSVQTNRTKLVDEFTQCSPPKAKQTCEIGVECLIWTEPPTLLTPELNDLTSQPPPVAAGPSSIGDITEPLIFNHSLENDNILPGSRSTSSETAEVTGSNMVEDDDDLQGVEREMSEIYERETREFFPVSKNMKQERIEANDDDDDDDVEIIELPEEKPIVIDDDVGTQELFNRMIAPNTSTNSQRSSNPSEVSSQGDPNANITASVPNASPMHTDWLSSEEYQRFASQGTIMDGTTSGSSSYIASDDIAPIALNLVNEDQFSTPNQLNAAKVNPRKSAQMHSQTHQLPSQNTLSPILLSNAFIQPPQKEYFTSPTIPARQISTRSCNIQEEQNEIPQSKGRKRASSIDIVTKKAKKTNKGTSMKTRLDETQVPKYTYNSLELISTRVNNLPQIEKTQSTSSSDPECNIQSSDTPPMAVNALEYIIEEFSSQEMGDSPSTSNVGFNRSILSNTKNLLNTQDSVFFSSQLPTETQLGINILQPVAMTTPADISNQREIENDNPHLLSNRNDDNDDIFAQSNDSMSVVQTEAVLTVPALNCPNVDALEDQQKLKERKYDKAPKSAQFLNQVNNIDSNESPPNESEFNDETRSASATPQTNGEQDEPISLSKISEGTSTTESSEPAAIAGPHTTNCAIRPLPTFRTPFIRDTSHFEFLNYINIHQASFKIDTRINPGPDVCNKFNDLKTTLNFSCNGHHKVVLNGHSTRKLLKLNDLEWSAVQEILHAIREFSFSERGVEPVNHSVLHRSLYFLFRTASRFSSAIIEYREEDFNEVHILQSTFKLPKEAFLVSDVSIALDPFVIERLKYEKQNTRKSL